jgi:hypothetical protein
VRGDRRALRLDAEVDVVGPAAAPPEVGDPLDISAMRLSAPVTVGHDGPSFHLELEG